MSVNLVLYFAKTTVKEMRIETTPRYILYTKYIMKVSLKVDFIFN